MSVTLTSPGALWLLTVVPVLWLALRVARTNFNPRQQRLQAMVRSALLVVLALALARPVISMDSDRTSIVYLVDISHSIGSQAITDAAGLIDELEAALRPDHSAVMVFGLEAASIAGTDALRAIAAEDPAGEVTTVPREGSDLERALAEAQAELAPGHVPRLVLFSDGRQTQGDVSAAAARLAADGLPVFVEPMAVRHLGDAWIDALTLPERLAAGALHTAVVRIGSQREGPAVVELRAGADLLGRQAIQLVPGAMEVPVDVSFDAAGSRAIEAILAVADDPLAANNRLTREAFVTPRSQVLYVEGAAGSAHYLEEALERSGFDVETRSPSSVPESRAALDPWDVVILSDVGRRSISDAAMTAMADWVEQSGGGLLMAGGEAVYGEGEEGDTGGYRNTELERLMPVTFERKDEPEVALIIVLDRSWSMAGQVMELCKSAAQAAIDVLTDEQSVGVITFNDGLNWDVTLRNVGQNREMIRDAIGAIQPAGHTLIYPAIEQAFFALRDARARAKHVVLLSDGRSYPDDYETLVRQMVDAKITVSSIAVGPAADVELLTNIANWGEGRPYVVADAREVPQIFVKEARDAATPAFDEESIQPVLTARGFLEDVDFSNVPPLRGRTATVLKDTALELVSTEDEDPLLAYWPIGMGRTAVFASDVKDRWASDWVRWRGYAPFFASIVRSLERQRRPLISMDVTEGVVRGTARPLAIAFEARDENGNYRDLLQPRVRVDAANGTVAEVTAQQRAPGRYEASVVADARQPLSISMVGQPDVPARLIVPDPDREYRFSPPDEAGLAALARATGGSAMLSADAIASTAASRQTARRALWPLLVVLALLVWLGDVVLRRVRLFEPAV
jgi:uncharacterized membrane protein